MVRVFERVTALGRYKYIEQKNDFSNFNFVGS